MDYMAKRRARRTVSRSTRTTSWAGFTPFQLIVIFSVFVILAVFYLM